MYKQLIINVTEHETRVALLDDGNIAELYVDRGDDSDIAGNIYKGRVLRVLPGMQAAFVNIGLNQAAFIYVDDVFHDGYKEYERLFGVESEGPVHGLRGVAAAGATGRFAPPTAPCASRKPDPRIRRPSKTRATPPKRETLLRLPS